MDFSICKARQNRKLEHIIHALAVEEHPSGNGLGDVYLIHQAIPELSIDEIDISYRFEGKELAAPLLINAITGGNKEVITINRQLSRLARDAGIAMAVGSQFAALENRSLRDTYSVVRDENPFGVIFANVGALTPPELAGEAVNMIAADALQVHLNVPQELAMEEGDRDFKAVLNNLAQMINLINVPIIIKEVGFGFSKEAVKRLYQLGVKWIDIGGSGGTNFITIERHRGSTTMGQELECWGIPTTISLLEALSLDLPVNYIATGGIKNSLQVAKCLALGSEMVGIAGHFLRLLVENSERDVAREINNILKELRMILLMSGARDLSELKKKPVIIMGKTREWLKQRGILTDLYSKR